jgi:hypothetical protein
MSARDESPPADPALAPYLDAPDEGVARARLGDLLGGVAVPLVWRIVRRQLGGRGGNVPEADLEDLHGATILRLQLHLSSVRAGDNPAMASFADYVAVTAFNACSAFLMAREPERTRLRHRVRYVLRKHARLATWTGAGQEALCGLAAWSGRRRGDDGERLDETALEVAATSGRVPARFAALVVGVIERMDAPCRVERLVDALALALDVRDEPLAALPGDGVERPAAPGAQEPADGGRSALDGLQVREALEALWAEIRELLPNQRSALLLNLRDAGGGDLLTALVGSGVAAAGEVADALGMPESELRAALPELPWDDLRIAERLGLSRQQVINLRKSARLRLARRMRGILPTMGG